MTSKIHKGGRPRLTEEQKQKRKQYLLQKLEPYLMSGLSVNKALKETQILNSEFYKYMSEDEYFGEKIERFKQYISVLANQAIVTELIHIVEKQKGNKAKNIVPQSLSKDDRNFLWWFALNANMCREEWSHRQEHASFDPELEIQRVQQLIGNTVGTNIH